MEPFGRQEMFEKSLSLMGKDLELGLNDGRQFRGKIAFTSFDSLLFEYSGTKEMIRFDEIFFLNPLRRS